MSIVGAGSYWLFVPSLLPSVGIKLLANGLPAQNDGLLLVCDDIHPGEIVPASIETTTSRIAQVGWPYVKAIPIDSQYQFHPSRPKAFELLIRARPFFNRKA